MDRTQFTAFVAAKAGRPVKYIEDVKVVEEFWGEAWNGLVSIYESETGICYAWVDPDLDEVVVVEKKPPVEKPLDAVNAYIAARP